MIGYSPKRPYATAALQKNVPAVRIDNPLHADAFSVNGSYVIRSIPERRHPRAACRIS
jgi:hypothetical protein